MFENSTTTVLPAHGDAEAYLLRSRVLSAAALGLALHHLVFRKGEWHMQAPALFALWALSYPILAAVEVFLGAESTSAGLKNALLIEGGFAASLFTSIAVYRVFFHRLRGFSGPPLAKVSKLWHSVQCVGGQNHLVLERLRQQYGDFVRTGPSEITIFTPEAMVQLDGIGNKNTKPAFYDFLHPNIGIENIRDRPFHDERRRIWTQAFSSKALPAYERMVAEQAVELEKLIASVAERDAYVPFSRWVYWFQFDVMGLFTLSRSFGMMQNEKWHDRIAGLRNAMSVLGIFAPVPWLAQVGFFYLKHVWAVRDWHRFRFWCEDQVKQQIKINDESTCVTSFFIADAIKRDALEADFKVLAGDTITSVVAGSDTVGFTMTCLFWELASNPQHIEMIYEEVKDVDYEDRKTLEQLPHLNACINETLRLHPAVPTGGCRDTPPEGATISGRFIPGNITVCVPRYSVFRSEKCYEQPNSFIPERWYSKPELIKDNRAFMPFAQGRYSCLGKSLALTELRTVTALLVSKYRFEFVQDYKPAQFELGVKDQFTAAPGELPLKFVKRN
ncbi:cytochrome P450 [Stachybotrys elegans]|uniref:Cytochrome P450 n=1 Tax=Stachybotrys elegans TaxID=80388 RepID=A0A8K0SSB5_9HYPO|nr:cytochrome P450 [Stachybotrys elegans]